MIDASSNMVPLELVELLRAMMVLFPDQYPHTKGWLSEQRALYPGASLSKVDAVPVEAMKSSPPAGDGEAKKPPSGHKRDGRRKQQGQRFGPVQHERPTQQHQHVPVVPAFVWPELARGMSKIPSPALPVEWARAHGYGMQLQWDEQQQLMNTFAGRLAFPRSRVGPMGALLSFSDSWQASVGEISVFVYRPRESSPEFVLIDVVRDDKVVAQFEVPLQLVDAKSVMGLLPVEWRRVS